MSNTPLSEQDRAAEMAAGLRDLAAMSTEHPSVASDLRCGLTRWLVSVGHGGQSARAQMLAFARAGTACGAKVTEFDDGYQYAGVDVAFGAAVSLHVYADVEKVHGTTRRTVEQTEDGTTRRIVEYAPRPILTDLDTADPTDGAAAA
jgi:hypothetical protein